ncbi:hypothetical protein Bhyg_01242 [Pseudolycoriella hygida]|uniref:Uncharacterized protein n=1 Tax=Pseudolycoriella hygida TaxID=35572 RepID=A0A9Q0N9G8_9DIPT|nr:hypothetical protein Bhyg_01242 [Pseudolycoriella hygida]
MDESSTSQTKINVTESTSTWEKIDNDIFVHAVQNTIIEIHDDCSQPNHNIKKNISVIMNVQDKTKRNDRIQIKQEKHDGRRNSKYQRKKKQKKFQNTRYSTRFPHKSHCILCGEVRPKNRSHSHQCRGIFSAANPWTSERNCMPRQIDPLRGVTNPYNPWYGRTNSFAAKMQSLSPPRADTGGLSALTSWINNRMNALQNVTMISDGSWNSCRVSNNVSMAASSGNLLNVVDSQHWNASGTNDVIHPSAFGNIHNAPPTRDAEKTRTPASIDNPIKAYEEIRTNVTESTSASKEVNGTKIFRS